MIAVIGEKSAMCQLYDELGIVRPSTAIKVPGCVVVAKRTRAAHGYEALQLGTGVVGRRQLTKPLAGHFKKAGVDPVGVVREVRVDSTDNYQVGQKLGVELFQPGDKVSVTGMTKGRGFAGGMKRWGWHGGPGGHGSMTHRRSARLARVRRRGACCPGGPWPVTMVSSG